MAMPSQKSKVASTPKGQSPTAWPNPQSLGIVNWPAAILKQRAAEIAEVTPQLLAIADRMLLLMQEHKGVGLAGPQVGLPLRLFVMSETGKADDGRVFINPVLTLSGETEEGEEGCLSIPEVRAKIMRSTEVYIEATGLDGERQSETLAGFAARIAQHESDHLNGILILDHMSAMARIAHRQALAQLRAAAEPVKKR